MDQNLHVFLVWLFSVELNPFVVPILSLIVLPFKVSSEAVSGRVERNTLIPIVIGVMSGFFLYFPNMIANTLGFDVTAFSVLSMGVGATGIWYFGSSIVDMLGLEIAALLLIIATTKANQHLV